MPFVIVDGIVLLLLLLLSLLLVVVVVVAVVVVVVNVEAFTAAVLSFVSRFVLSYLNYSRVVYWGDCGCGLY